MPRMRVEYATLTRDGEGVCTMCRTIHGHIRVPVRATQERNDASTLADAEVQDAAAGGGFGGEARVGPINGRTT